MELKPTTRVAEALALAQRAAQSAGHPEITPSHLALALAEQQDTSTPALLEAAGTTAEQVAENVKASGVKIPAGLMAAIDDALAPNIENDPAKTVSPAKRPA